MMEWKDYADFMVTDFLTDDFFMEWVLRPNAENRRFWEEWQQHYVEKQPLIAEARAILLSLEYYRHKMPEESYDRIWNALHQKMEEEAPPVERVPHAWRWRRAAVWAGICMLAAGGYWLFRHREHRELYTSQFGENRHLVLQDSSIVILGPHSSLRTAPFRPGNGTREVWLDGEAYFMVKSRPGISQAFTVHTGGLDIEVLGTAFNVNNYNGNPRIVLHSGKVALHGDADGAQRIILEPGDMVEYQPERKSYTRKKVVPEKYTAWVDNTLVFDSTSLRDVAVELHNRYGIRLRFADSSLMQETFSATLRQADYTVVIKALQEAFNIQVKQKGNTFILSK